MPKEISKKNLYKKKWRKENKEHCRKYCKNWRKENPEKVKEQQKRKKEKLRLRYKKDREYRFIQITKSKEWAKKNPKKANFRSNRYKIKRRGAIGSHTLKEWEKLKKAYKYTCLCCGKSEPKIKLEADHIIPISKNGTNYIWNIQPLCRSCNASKSNTLERELSE